MVGKMGTERKQYSCGSARGEKFYYRVRRFMLEQEMVRQGEAVIAGVSGGADSLCLFQVLLRLSREIKKRERAEDVAQCKTEKISDKVDRALCEG